MNGGLKKWISEKRALYKGAFTIGEGLPEVAEGDDYSYAASEPDRVI